RAVGRCDRDGPYPITFDRSIDLPAAARNGLSVLEHTSADVVSALDEQPNLGGTTHFDDRGLVETPVPTARSAGAHHNPPGRQPRNAKAPMRIAAHGSPSSRIADCELDARDRTAVCSVHHDTVQHALGDELHEDVARKRVAPLDFCVTRGAHP